MVSAKSSDVKARKEENEGKVRIHEENDEHQEQRLQKPPEIKSDRSKHIQQGWEPWNDLQELRRIEQRANEQSEQREQDKQEHEPQIKVVKKKGLDALEEETRALGKLVELYVERNRRLPMANNGFDTVFDQIDCKKEGTKQDLKDPQEEYGWMSGRRIGRNRDVDGRIKSNQK